MKPLTVLLIIFNLNTAYAQNIIDQAIGKWKSSDGMSIIYFQKNQSNKLTATLSWLKNSMDNGKEILDEKNKNASLRKRKLVGITLISEIKEYGNKLVGSYYDPESGETYPCSITIKNNIMSIEVCDDSGWFCETEKLTKVNDLKTNK